MSMMPLPSSLRDFKDVPPPNEVHPRAHWTQFETFMASHGFTLWLPTGTSTMMPPDDRPRTPDGFHYWFDEGQYAETPYCPEFMHTTPIVCPARMVDGRDVVIRIVSIGDEGVNHRTALERLSTGNHCRTRKMFPSVFPPFR